MSASSHNTAWVDGLTIAQALERTVERFAGRDAVVFPRLGLRWSYAQFAEEVERTARAFAALGLRHGGHVGLWSTNWPQWIVTQFAVARLGAVLVNVNPAYRTFELEYALRRADIEILVATDTFKTTQYEEMLARLLPALPWTPYGAPLRETAFPKLRHVVSIKDAPSLPGIWPWKGFLENGEGALAAVSAAGPDSPANIQFTSGTTGAPKGATLSHRNLLMNAFHVGRCLDFSEVDRLCIPVPFYHCFGCVMGTLMCAVSGAAMVVPADYFDAAATVDAAARERCTGIHGVPAMFAAELALEDLDRYDFSAMRTGIMAGSGCPIALVREVAERMHCSGITIAYGQTEASPVITQTHCSEPLEVRAGTVGRALPGVEVRLVDPVSGEGVPDGAQGELWARGHGVMLGYYNMPEATAATVTADGWLRTGDLAQCTATGHYRITGRIKDMIIRGGENIYPREIEEFLLGHPKVRDVQIVGLPDARYGEQVSAWIVRADPSLDKDEVLAYCRENISHYKVPFYVEFVEEFPATVTGKVQKFVLRDMGIERFGLHVAAAVETA